MRFLNPLLLCEVKSSTKAFSIFHSFKLTKNIYSNQRLIMSSSENKTNMDNEGKLNSGIPLSDSLIEEKKKLRLKIKKELKTLSVAQKRMQDAKIQQYIMNSPFFKNSDKVCAYIHCHSLMEVSTQEILQNILNEKKYLFVPRVLNNHREMCFLKILNLENDLEKNKMSIFEPTLINPEGEKRQNLMEFETPVDIFLVPGLAFDQYGGRLGRGGGYYDAFLKSYFEHARGKGWKLPLLVGLAYDIQIRKEGLPMASEDVYVDAIVSSEDIIFEHKLKY